jgi:hypothetical protein
MIQYVLKHNEYKPDIYRLEAIERPPMVSVPAYREKFNLN